MLPYLFRAKGETHFFQTLGLIQLEIKHILKPNESIYPCLKKGFPASHRVSQDQSIVCYQQRLKKTAQAALFVIYQFTNFLWESFGQEKRRKEE